MHTGVFHIYNGFESQLSEVSPGLGRKKVGDSIHNTVIFHTLFAMQISKINSLISPFQTWYKGFHWEHGVEQKHTLLNSRGHNFSTP